MSFQRMLMMATREARPYLPHPEALVCLYMPRWQTEQGNTLYDYSGNNRHMTIRGAKTWTAEALMQEYNTRIVWTGNAGTIKDYTVIADRDTTTAANKRSYGLVINDAPTRVNFAVELHYANTPTNAIKVYSNGALSDYLVLAPDGWIYQRATDYNGIAIPRGTEYRSRLSISMSRFEPMWTTIRAVCVWSLALTDKEIEMAKLFLSTASLEDYMMSRL